MEGEFLQKKKGNNINAAASVPVQALRLQDNRSKTVLQQKQAEQKTIQRQENNTGLPDHLKSGIENLSGYSMDDVKVHYNSLQPAQLNAHAYAQGNQIHIAPGQEKHLAHEAWHVVQQKQGRVKPTKQLKGKTNINDDTGLEKEADVMGAKANKSFAGTTRNLLAGHTPGQLVQRVIYLDPQLSTEPDIISLQQNALYKILNGKQQNIYIKLDGGETDMMVRTTHNTDDFNAHLPGNLKNKVDYLIKVNPSIFTNHGLNLDPKRIYGSLAGQQEEIDYSHTIKIFDINRNPVKTSSPVLSSHSTPFIHSGPSAFSPLSPSSVPKGLFSETPVPFLPFDKAPSAKKSPDWIPKLKEQINPYLSAGNKLSAFTVILHELGHIEQHMRTPQKQNGPGIPEITFEHAPKWPDDLVAKVAQAYATGNLRDTVWFELVDLKNVMQKWLGPFKDEDEDRHGGSMKNLIAEIDQLGDNIVHKAMIWIEYDNITHTEHPAAKELSEPIRHIHGTEMRVHGGGIVDTLNAQNTATLPVDLLDVNMRMANNAVSLTTGIVQQVIRYQQIFFDLMKHKMLK